ncbi:MAG: ATP-binding cassette domain-containing protein [Treponema sp.]|nr:ATP-binding cassette domain-containing protein [Treponema sp.]
MKLIAENISFSFGNKKIFENFSLCLDSAGILPAVILGPSGCGKTTLLRLLAGLLEPTAGEIFFDHADCDKHDCDDTDYNDHNFINASFVFQEPRLLPWYTVLENVMLPIQKLLGKKQAQETGLRYLELVSLLNEAYSYPEKLSGGQRQRAAIARAFAYPSKFLFLDEPFQSMDIPLRIELMELCLSLLEKENRLAAAVTHDPREAVFMGGRIIVMGQRPCGIIFDYKNNLAIPDRNYGEAAAGELEKLLIEKLRA